MKRRITKIGHPVDCFHCGQLVEYPAPHFDASPGVGMDVEKFCSARCHSLACTGKEGRSTAGSGPNTPRAVAEPTVRTNIARTKQIRAAKRRVAEAHRKEVIRNALNRPRS